MTPEEKAKDLEARVKGFNEELIPLLGKYKIGLGAQALILPDGRLAARPHLFDDTPKEAETPKVESAPVENKPTDLAAA